MTPCSGREPQPPPTTAAVTPPSPSTRQGHRLDPRTAAGRSLGAPPPSWACSWHSWLNLRVLPGLVSLCPELVAPHPPRWLQTLTCHKPPVPVQSPSLQCSVLLRHRQDRACICACLLRRAYSFHKVLRGPRTQGTETRWLHWSPSPAHTHHPGASKHRSSNSQDLGPARDASAHIPSFPPGTPFPIPLPVQNLPGSRPRRQPAWRTPPTTGRSLLWTHTHPPTVRLRCRKTGPCRALCLCQLSECPGQPSGRPAAWPLSAGGVGRAGPGARVPGRTLSHRCGRQLPPWPLTVNIPNRRSHGRCEEVRGEPGRAGTRKRHRSPLCRGSWPPPEVVRDSGRILTPLGRVTLQQQAPTPGGVTAGGRGPWPLQRQLLLSVPGGDIVESSQGSTESACVPLAQCPLWPASHVTAGHGHTTAV